MKRAGGTPTGNLGEDMAVTHLKARGYRIVERNWRCPSGEIDIIAIEEDTLVFIEVKTRSKNSLGSPFDAVSYSKKKKILRAVKEYLAKRNSGSMCLRFDVVGVTLGGGKGEVELIRDAFTLDSSWE